MTDEEKTPAKGDDPYYIPPTVGPDAKTPKKPEKKTGNDWISVVYFIIAIFVLIAAFQLYFVLQELIRTWISDQFVPVVSAAYYIVIIVGGVWLLRDYVRKQ